MIRLYEKEDEPFIFSTWLKGLYNGNSWFKEINFNLFYSHYHKVIENILRRKKVYVLCICFKEDPDIILSYAVLEKVNENHHILHWVFTKTPWRRFTFAKELLPSTIKEVTHLTKLGKVLKPKNWMFNPFLI